MVRRRAWLARLPGRTPKNVRELAANGRRSLTMVLGWRDVGHELRRRIWVPSAELNVEATLDSVLWTAGSPRLVFGSRVEPEYVALIDEASDADHLARLGDQLTLAFEHRDVSVRRFFFRDNPERCEGPSPGRKPRAGALPIVALDDLLTRYRDNRFILISDGRSFFDRLTGEPRRAAYQLASARDAVVLTPATPEKWGRREWALSQLGFTVLPLTPAGLEQLGELYGSEKPVKPPRAAAASRAPPRWVHDPLSMLMPTPPSRLTPAALCELLLKELGAVGFRLLQVASVYPEIHWGITVRVGAAVLSPRQLAESLPRLAQLPWFRHGHMPSWLRTELLQTLPEGSWLAAQSAIRSVLEAARTDVGGEIPLRVAAPPVLPWWRMSERAPANDAGIRMRRDAVFLRFMQGPRRLSVAAVEAIRRLFFRDGLWALGARMVPVAALAAAAVLLVGMQLPVFARRDEIKVITREPPPSVIAIAATGAGDAPFIASYSNGDLWKLAGNQAVQFEPPFETAVRRMTRYEDGMLVAEGTSSDGVRFDPSTFPRSPSMRRPYVIVRSEGIAVFGVGQKSIFIPARLPLCAAISKDGSTVTAVSPDRVQQFALSTVGGEVERISNIPSRESLNGCNVEYSGNYIVAWSNRTDPQTVWRIEAGRPTGVSRYFEARSGLPIGQIAATAAGLVAVSRGSTIEVYDPSNPANPETISSGTNTFAIADDGARIAAAAANGAVDVWKSRKTPDPPRARENELGAVPSASGLVVDSTPSKRQEQTTEPVSGQSGAAPVITISSGARVTDRYKDPYRLNGTIRAGDARSGIGRVTVSVNGAAPTLIRLGAGGELSQDLNLDAGSNSILVDAADATNTNHTTHLKLVFKDGLETQVMYLLNVGVDRYEGAGALRYAVSDAKAFGDMLKRREPALYLIDDRWLPNPDRNLFLKQLKFVLGAARRQDVVVIFFAGRSESVEFNPALLFRDYNGQPPAGMVYISEIDEALRRTEAQKIVLVIDACRSELEGSAGAPLNDYLPSLHSGSRSYVLLSAASNCQTAFESPQLQHGLLTYALLEGMNGAAEDMSPGFIDAWSLAKYVQTHVVNLARDLNQQQSPEFVTSGQNFILLPAAPAAQTR
jgi:hypothetical protein